mgnify:CR=1 FL=1
MRAIALALAATLFSASALAATVGQKAPDFTAVDSNGQSHKLSDFAGKTVVLEWTNHECPFVKKHYGAGNMQKQQAAAVADGVVWLKINSGAPGKQGHVDGAAANAVVAREGSKATAYLLDHSGEIGKAYAAKTTPHMYVIDGAGVLQYNGAIDSNPSADPADIPGATQYVVQALAELKAGTPVSTPTSKPYGCSVKYGS